MLVRLIACVLILALLPGFTFYSSPAPKIDPPDKFINLTGLQIAENRSSVDPLLTSDTSSCSIPFTLAGKLIIVKGRADNTEGNFILDTGSPNLVLNITYFRDYPIETSQGETQESITGQGTSVQRTILKLFKLGTLNYHRAEADLLSLAHVENSKGLKILGLLGVALFKQCELVIDYKTRMIHLHHIGKKERKTYQHEMLKDTSRYMAYPFELANNRILIKTNFYGSRIPFVVDVGAEENIIDSRLPEKILDSVKVSGRIILTGAGQRKIEVITGSIPRFTLGALSINDLPFMIMNLEYTCFGKENCVNGVLGQEFISRYTIVFNFAKQTLYLLDE